MELGVFLLAMVKQASVLAYDGFVWLKLFSLYRSTQNKLLKKVWLACMPIELLGIGLIVYKVNYRFWISETPQPTYLFFARFHYIFWPLAIFLGMLAYDWIIGVEEKLHKRHYALGAVAISLSSYYFYYFCVQEADPANPWLTLDSVGLILGNLFIIASRGSTLLYGLKKLIFGQVEGIVKEQTKLILRLTIVPVMLLQSIWVLRNAKILPVDGFMPELFAFVLVEIYLACSAYGFWQLLRLRLFNAWPAVHRASERDLMVPFTQVICQIRQATVLQEVAVLTTGYFQKAFGFADSEVKLYIRPTHNERNLEAAQAVKTVERVEEWLEAKDRSLEVIKNKRILLHAELQYEELHNFNAEAKELRTFLEIGKAEVFLPVFGKKTLTGYIIIERNARAGKLVSDAEVGAMLAYVDHISHVIDQMQQFDSEVIEKECLMYKHQSIQLLQESEHYYEGMRAMVQLQASEAVSMVFFKNRCLQLASTDGAKLLGLPEGTKFLNNAYEQPIKQLMGEFKKYKQASSIALKDPQGNPLRFSVMKDSRPSNAVVVVSRPTVSETLRIPTLAEVRDRDDWGYALLLQTTASGKVVENFIPATRGALFNFKIKFLRAVLRRRPMFILGDEEDVQRLAILVQRIYKSAGHREISPEQPENRYEVAGQIFGLSPVVMGGDAYKGALADLSSSGVLLIRHVERLSLETQTRLAKFFATGVYSCCFSKQPESSDAIVVCSSCVDLKELVANNAFSEELYQELVKNQLEVPLLATLPNDQLSDLVSNIGMQMVDEHASEKQGALSSEEVEHIIKGPAPRSLCELRQNVRKFMEQKSSTQGFTAASCDVGYNNFHPVVVEARRLGPATLKNKQLFCALVALVPSYTEIAEILDVDYSTVRRTCRKYQVGTFAPGVERKPGRPRTRVPVLACEVPCS